jgi:hypothetical protein
MHAFIAIIIFIIDDDFFDDDVDDYDIANMKF